MMFDFDAVFHPTEEWKYEIVSDKCPCVNCPESAMFCNNPYFESSKCCHCVQYGLWLIDVHKKLYWLEHKEQTIRFVNEERCVVCGEIVPEGRQVCYKCERNAASKYDDTE